jgi:Ca2+-dependent lipid-binding protein
MARLQNDAAWFARETKAKLNKGQMHIDQARDHLNAASMIQTHDHEGAAGLLEKAGIHANAAGKHYMAHSKKWIQSAIKKTGSFTKQAKGAGMGVQAFASKVLSKGSKASTKTKRRARLAKTLAGFHK